MNHLRALLCVLAAVRFLTLSSSAFVDDSKNTRVNAAQDEMDLVAEALKSADAGELSSHRDLVSSASKLNTDEPHSVVFARRNVILCGWMQNQNKYAQATKIATWAVGLLSHLKEPNDAAHLERLYWEALLLGQFMDQKVKAIKLLDAATMLDPKDERISSLKLELSQSVGSFGR